MKKISFYLIALVLPIIFWLALEAGLHLFLDRFRPLRQDGSKQTFFLNLAYFKDYFLYQAEPFFYNSSSNRAIHIKKDQRLRIFCVGGSTTAGYPYNTLPEYQCPASFPNYLRAILQYNKNMPQIEMLNAGCNAFNSVSVARLVSDLVKYHPDILIVYIGQNEYFGPNEFALSKQANMRLNDPLLFNGFFAVRQTFLYQGMNFAIQKVSGNRSVGHENYFEWSKRNSISCTDTYNLNVLKKYSSNLRKIIRTAQNAGVKVIVCSPIVNLTFPPFISLQDRALTANEQQYWKAQRCRADTLFNLTNFDDALKIWQELKEFSPTCADLYYYAGMNLAGLQRYEEAEEELAKARDYDALPFRAKSTIIAECKKIAREEKVVLADLDQFFRDLSGKAYPAPQLLLDHVHPTEEGYFYVALFLARTIFENGLVPNAAEWQYPSIEKTRQVLKIQDFVVDKVEYDFAQKSYLYHLSKLNPAIGEVLAGIRLRAYNRAKVIGDELLKQEYQKQTLGQRAAQK